MPKKIALLTIVILILLGGGALVALNRDTDTAPAGTTSKTDGSTGTTQSSTPPPTASTETTGPQDSACPSSDSPEITYANGNFSPSCITVKAGTAVKWKNESNLQIQIGTDPHPSHTGNKEVSNGAFTLNLAGGATAESTLTTKGEHSYHDHLNPSATGTIVVQ